MYEFIDDIVRVLKTRPSSNEEKVDYLKSPMDGPAEEEIRYGEPSLEKDPQEVLDMLRKTFGEKSTPSELTADFYSTKQEENQTLQEFLHVFIRKLDKIGQVNHTFI